MRIETTHKDSPNPSERVSVPREAIAQAVAALDIAGRRDLAAWLMRTAKRCACVGGDDVQG